MGCLINHGESGSTKKTATREYRSWVDMRKRCNSNQRPEYKRYGGRGIQICKRWDDYKNFLSDMGRCPFRYTLERKNNNDGYYPENCKWASRKDQNNNRTSYNVTIEHEGMRLTVAQWADRVGLKKTTLWCRLHYYKWPISKALTMPVYLGGKEPKHENNKA